MKIRFVEPDLPRSGAVVAGVVGSVVAGVLGVVGPVDGVVGPVDGVVGWVDGLVGFTSLTLVGGNGLEALAR